MSARRTPRGGEFRKVEVEDAVRGELVEGLPELDQGERVIHEARRRTVSDYLVGIVLTFIPPFVWGPLLIAAMYYTNRSSGARLTDRRLIIFRKSFRPRFFRVQIIPKDRIVRAECLGFRSGAYDPRSPYVLERFLGIRDIRVEFKTEDGEGRAYIPNIRQPKALLEALGQ
jgi:hypothetical protein